MDISRRSLLAAGLSTAIVGCTSSTDAAPANAPASTAADSTTSTRAPTTTTTIALAEAPSYLGITPFALGTASGDPDGSSVVLWTRLRTDPLDPEPFSTTDMHVAIDVSVDESFETLVHSELHDARADHDHSVHAIVDGLDADTWYWYRMRLGDHRSRPARTRTLPDSGHAPLRLGFSSCQNWESGGYAAHRHLAADDLDLFVWLGDYIYEYGPGNGGVVGSAGLRQHTTPEVTDLAGYRQRYALYKSDPALQSHHETRPWIITWDDHELDNDHAGSTSEDGQDEQTFLARRRAAHQAWWENMPVRLGPPRADVFEIYRTLRWGELVDLHMLDGRQYRDPQPTDGEPVTIPGAGDGVRRLGPTARDPEHSMLGAAQRDWLEEEVRSSTATWNVLGNQVYMHGLNAFPGEEPATNIDTWDGYHGERKALLTSLTENSENLVVLSGDFHSSTVADLRADPFDANSPIVASEFMAPAISSAFPAQLRPLAPLVLQFNPQVRHFDPDNGYMTCEITADSWTTELHRLADVTNEDSSISVVARFSVRSGTPGIATVDLLE